MSKYMKRIISAMLIIAMLLVGAAVAESDFEPIAKGAKGNHVVEVQTYLKEQGYLSGKADGDFGGGTEKAVKAFQEANGLEATGIIDGATYYRLAGIPDPATLKPMDPELFDVHTLDSGTIHVLGLKEDGTCISVFIGDDDDKDDDYGQCNVEGWKDIVSVSAGMYSSLGLKSNGTVVAAGMDRDGQTQVKKWNNIIDIAAGSQHSVGLKADGTVVAVGSNEENQLNVSGWTDIVDVATGNWHTLGIRRDGTVAATGNNEYGQCKVGDWTDIVSVDGGSWISVGLKKDGRVVYAGGWDSDDRAQLNAVKQWQNIVYISVINDDVFGIDKDGKVYSVYSRSVPSEPAAAAAFCSWKNWGTFLLADGTVESRAPGFEGVKLAMPDHYELPGAAPAPASEAAADGTAAAPAATAEPARPADMGIWMLKAYVDEFDLPTDEYFVVNKSAFTGKFSNSATTNSKLEAYIFCEKTDNLHEYIDIRLFEYGQYRVHNSYSKTRYYDIAMMDKDGVKYYMDGDIAPDSSDITIWDEGDVQTIINALKKGGTVRFSITERNSSLTKYIFTINDASGFASAYDAWWVS